MNRRGFLLVATTTSCSAGSLLLITPKKASAAAETGETIRRGASKIPGYGPPDVYYPEIMRGKWNVIREQVTGDGQDNSNDNNNKYEIRFIESVEQNAVVADRGFNQASLEKSSSVMTPPTSLAIQSYDWLETNPNVLHLVFDNGQEKEIKVTKRSSERTDDTLTSSEFMRITASDKQGIPSISAQRVMTKYKVVNDDTVEGLELVYDMGMGGDPLGGALTPSSTTNNSPQLVSKSRLHLTRQK